METELQAARALLYLAAAKVSEGAPDKTKFAAMAKRFGMGVDLQIELPGTRSGFVPTREWRLKQGKPWNLGDTIVHGIGQGFYQLTPLSLATMTGHRA